MSKQASIIQLSAQDLADKAGNGSLIYGEMFWSRRPAWHDVGTVADRYMRAIEIAPALGVPETWKAPLYVPDGGKMVEIPGKHAIFLRDAETGLPQMIGDAVSNNYEHYSFWDAVKAFDENVLDENGVPVGIETMGVLRKGQDMFITVKLPSFGVGNDAVDAYFLYYVPQGGGTAIFVAQVYERVVCINTLRFALDSAFSKLSIPHYEGVGARAWETLRAEWRRMTNVTEAQEAMTVLTKTQLATPEVKWIVENVYPMPTAPDESIITRSNAAKRVARYQDTVAFIEMARGETYRLFEEGTGQDLPTARGTGWGLLNAVAEFETYRKARFPRVTVQNLFNGERGEAIQTAHKLILEAVR